MHVGSTSENNIKELDPRKAYNYLGIEESFDIQHKKEKEKLKKEYLRRLRLVLGTEYTTTETISEPFRKYVSNIPGKHEVKELQKTAILGTAHILQKVLM